MNKEDILEVVTKLNIELYEQGFTDKSVVQFSVQSNGFVVKVNILGITLWSSDDDERSWDSNLKEYESLEDYLRQEFGQVQDMVWNIELDY